MVAASTAFGYLIAQPALNTQFILSFLGTFLLACGAASFNSIQEKDSDASYTRTCKRPVASGLISKQHATYFAVLNCTLGLLLLALIGNTLLPFFLGLAALIIYNFIYTPLKPYSEFALLPGGLSGALPPAIGWTSAGGQLGDPMILTVMALFFLWQPPHFCLILLEYADDYRKKGTFQNLITKIPADRVKRIIAVWLLAFLSVVLLLTILVHYLPQTVRFTLVACTPLFGAGFLFHLFRVKHPRYKILFISLNGFLVGIMGLLSISSILNTL